MASKNKLLWTLVILLLAANTATLVIFWMGRGGNTPQPPQLLADYLTSQLSLDSSQQQQYKALVQAHRTAAAPMRRQIGLLKDSLFQLLRQGNPADSIKQAATAKIAAATQQLELLHLDHFAQVRALCTPAQQHTFDGLLQEIARRMAMQPPGQRPPGPPPGGRERPGPPPGERPDGPPPHGDGPGGPPPPGEKRP